MIHLLFGTERFLIEQKQNEIIRKELTPEEWEFSFSSHDMRETPVQTALESAQTVSFLGGKQVILIKDAYFFTGEKAKEKVDHDVDSILEYLKNPNEDAVIIFTVNAEKLDSRKKVVKEVAKVAKTKLDAKPLKIGQLYSWIDRYCSDNDIQIEDEAINLLITYIGPNLMSLSQEIMKMAIYAGKDTITRDIVEQLVSRTLEQDIFKLIDRIVNKELGEAFNILSDMYIQGEDPIKILLLIVRQFRIIYSVKVDSSKAASRVGVAPFVINIAKSQAQQYSIEELLKILSKLTDLDYQMKTGRVNKHTELEKFILSLV